ncbi:MAG TPA: ribonuclease D [Cellvibrionaceae bacterium]
MPIPTKPIWVDDPAMLQQLCSRWRQQAAIAVDTEFMRSDTFFPIAGLIQIGDGEGCYLIDPLAFDDLSPLAELLTDTQVTKVFHASSEDMEVFQVLLNVVPNPIFDTQIGAAFAGCGYSMGYAALAKSLLQVDIPKGETRSDWLQRPLSVAQCEYAALDVAHLLIVYGKLLQQLKPLNRLGWVRDDCAALVAAARTEPDIDLAYEKVGLAWKLDGPGLVVLQAVCRWREIEARVRDIPRNLLLKEPQLFEIARRQPTELGQLQRIDGMPRRTLHEDGETLLDIVATVSALPDSAWPPKPDLSLDRRYGPVMKALKECVRDIAEALDLPPELLIRKKEYEQLVRSGLDGGTFVLPPRLTGWRQAVIGDRLLIEVERAMECVE